MCQEYNEFKNSIQAQKGQICNGPDFLSWLSFKIVTIFIDGAVFIWKHETQKGKCYFQKILSEGWRGNLISSLEPF